MFNQLAEKIKELEGIISCKIIGEKEIDEIHIVAKKERAPKRIVRDVETLVYVDLEQEISHKKISIAQVNENTTASIENRVEIVSIYKEYNNSIYHFKLKVNNTMIEDQLEGCSEEPVPLVVARGLLELMVRHTNFKGKIRVENVFTTGINNEILIVQLVFHQGKNGLEKERLLGAAYINQDILLATGKACLKALNRRLSICIND